MVRQAGFLTKTALYPGKALKFLFNQRARSPEIFACRFCRSTLQLGQLVRLIKFALSQIDMEFLRSDYLQVKQTLMPVS
jgi:hypothetical protein